MKLFFEYIVIFFNLSPTSSHLHPLKAENCDSNSRLVVDEDDNVKSGLKGLNTVKGLYYLIIIIDVALTIYILKLCKIISSCSTKVLFATNRRLGAKGSYLTLVRVADRIL